jgi:hypothetical protein
MNRLRITGWAVVVLALLALSGAPLTAQGGWSNYESDRYVVITDGSADDAKDVLASMESMWGVYCEVFGMDPKKKPDEKLKVRVYGTHQGYLAKAPRRDADGYYQTHTRELTSFVKKPVYLSTLAHEGMHQFHDLLFPGLGTRATDGSIPFWYVEGVAECFGNMEIRNGEAWICMNDGEITRKWLHDVKPWVANPSVRPPLNKLIHMSQREFMANARINYGVSFMFAHFLFNYPDYEPTTSRIPSGKYAEIIQELHKGFAAGKKWDELFGKLFKGDSAVDKIEKEFIDYIAAIPNQHNYCHGMGCKATKHKDGAQLKHLLPHGLAAKSGLQENDVVVQVDKTTIASKQDLQKLSHDFEPGKKYKFTVLRGGKKKSVTVKFGQAKKR